MVSCSVDDVWETGSTNKDGKRTLVMNIANPADDGLTRSSFGADNVSTRYFNTGDQVRGYDELLQKYDLFDYNQTDEKFETETDYVEEPKYTLFPSNMVEYGSWKPETGMYALMKLAVYGDESKNGTLTYAEDDMTVGEGTVPAYLSNIPEFGKVTNYDKEANRLQATPVYLTGILQIKIENGAGNVKAIRVRSLDEEGAPNLEKPLWGYFDAVLDAESDMTGAKNKSMLKPSTDALAAAKFTEANCTLIVELDQEAMKKYTSYVYIPIIPTTTQSDMSSEEAKANNYPRLVVDALLGDDWETETDVKTIVDYTDRQIACGGRYKSLNGEEFVLNGFKIEKEASTLAEIQEVLNEAAAIGSDVTVSLTIKNAIEIQYSGNAADYTLTIPATLKGQKVTLDCTGPTGNEAITTGDRAYDIFQIKSEQGAKGTLAIKGAAVLGAINADLDDVNLELSYGKYGAENKQMTFNTPTLTLGEGVVFNSELELTATNVNVNGEVKFQNDATLSATGTVTVAESGKIEAEISAATVTISGEAADIKATGAVTVNEGAKVTGDIEAATATVAGEVKGLTVTTSATVTDAKVETITTTTGTITINNEEEEGKLDYEISEIKLLGAATVNLNNGFVKKITNEDEDGKGTAATIVSKGKSAIASVTKADAAKITSYWDGEYYTGLNSSNGAYKDYATKALYTASQLTSPNGSSELYADVYLNTNETSYEWKGISRTNSNFDGKNHTIYGVKLAATAKGFINNAKATSQRSITNLTIDGFTAEGTLEKTGALVGTVTATDGTLTISGVEVKNASIKGDDESHDLGGLIGTINGTVNITKDVKVAATVEGYYNLGVLIGNMTGTVKVAENGAVSIASGSKLTVVKTYAADEVYDENAGKAGYVVGQILSNGSLSLYSNSGQFGSEVKAASVDPINDLHYDLCRLTANKKDYYFRGCLSASGAFQYFVGFSPEAGQDAYKKVTTNDINQTNCYNGEESAPNMEVTKNAFNVFKTTKQ